MPVKSWNVGDVLSAADMNAWTVPLAVIKPPDTQRNNTTTMTNDPDLQLSLAAGAVYDITAILQYKGTTLNNSDIKVTVNAPGGATGFWINYRLDLSLLGQCSAQPLGTGQSAGSNGTANLEPYFIKASVTTVGAGTVAIAWAQNTSNATNTTVTAGSILSAQRIG